MITLKQKSFLLHVGLFVGLALTACSPDPVPYPPLQQNEIDLKESQKVVELFFKPGKVMLSDEDQQELFRHLTVSGGLGRASIHATLPAIHPKKEGTIHQRRVHYLMHALIEGGLTQKQIHFAQHLPKPCKNQLSIILTTYRAIPPKCPNWSRAYGGAEHSLDQGQYGCSTKHNFVEMVEDPIVFFKTKPSTQYDTARVAKGIENYRTGREKPLKIENTTTGGSTSK